MRGECNETGGSTAGTLRRGAACRPSVPALDGESGSLVRQPAAIPVSAERSCAANIPKTISLPSEGLRRCISMCMSRYVCSYVRKCRERRESSGIIIATISLCRAGNATGAPWLLVPLQSLRYAAGQGHRGEAGRKRCREKRPKRNSKDENVIGSFESVGGLESHSLIIYQANYYHATRTRIRVGSVAESIF